MPALQQKLNDLPWRRRLGKKHKSFVSRLSFSMVTSAFALAISLFTFYVNYIKETHALRYVVVSAHSTYTEFPIDFEVKSVLMNHGNKVESAPDVSLGLSWGPKRDNGEQIDLVRIAVDEMVKGPFVIKGGDAIAIQHKFTITKELFEGFRNQIREENGQPPNKFKLRFYITVVSPEGKAIQLSREVANLTLETDDGVKYWSFESNRDVLEKIFNIFEDGS